MGGTLVATAVGVVLLTFFGNGKLFRRFILPSQHQGNRQMAELLGSWHRPPSDRLTRIMGIAFGVLFLTIGVASIITLLTR